MHFSPTQSKYQQNLLNGHLEIHIKRKEDQELVSHLL